MIAGLFVTSFMFGFCVDMPWCHPTVDASTNHLSKVTIPDAYKSALSMTYGRVDQQYNTVMGGVDDVVAKVHDNIMKCSATTW